MSNRSLVFAVVCSAGIRSPMMAQSAPSVIEYQNPSSTQRLADNALRVDIGGAGGVEFHRIGAILPMRNGGFAVVNESTSELRFFNAAGGLTSTSGRKGQGPGEYSAIRHVGRLSGDSIAVFDQSARRVSILDAAGNFVRSFQAQAPWEGGGSVTSMTATLDGTVFVGYSEVRQMAPRAEAVVFGQRLFQYSTTGELRSPTGIGLTASEHFIQAVPREMGGVAYWNLAFGRVTTVRGSAASLFVGDGTEWTIEERNKSGAVVTTHRLGRTPALVTPAEKQAYGDAGLAGSEGSQRIITERRIAEMPWPKTKPAYRRFEIDGTGRVWIEAYPGVGQTQSEWIRLDPRARTATSVTLPDRFSAVAFTASQVFGVWRDSDDVEHVRVYSLEGIR